MLSESRRGQGRLALIGGEAGIGKTSLVDRFCSDSAGVVQVLWGSCDPVVPARPFAPLRDIADEVGGSLRVALDAADRDRILEAFLDMLRRPAGPSRVIVLDDMHWADEATLDLLRIVGRRLRSLRVLVIATYRDDEVSNRHPLRLALGDLPPGTLVEIQVPPLSPAAVAELARGVQIDPAELHRTTGGNPFFVTEVVAGGGAALPASVSDAVLARVRWLSAGGQEVAGAASVIGQHCEAGLLLEVAGQNLVALDECLARGVLRAEDGLIGFRHELARDALLATLGASHRVALHARALAVLQRDAIVSDPARLARHAVGTGDMSAVIELAPAAGRRAVALGSHREAVAHYSAAVRFKDFLDDRSRAELLEAYAQESRLVDDVQTALRSQEEALECWRRVGDRVREANCLRELSTTMYYVGVGERPVELADAAVSILETVGPPGHDLALAVANVAQRRLLMGGDDHAALALGVRALELAEGLHDEPVAVHALTTIGVTEIYMGNEKGWARLDQSWRRAAAAGLAEDAARALINRGETALDMRRLVDAARYIDEALRYVEEHDFVLARRLLIGRRAELALRLGDWDAAARDGQALLDRIDTASQVKVRALTLMGRLRTRRGEGDPWALFDDALGRIMPGDLQELSPLHAARAEAAWLAGDAERARAEAEIALPLALRTSSSPAAWQWGELAFWAWRSGGLDRLPDGAPEPYRLHAAGQHREAAAAWGRIGCPYEEAMALADSDDADHLRRALQILQDLGAQPLADVVSARLRGRGARAIPRGPRRSTRGNPAHLTSRELQVLGLLAAGLRNADIAERLVLSGKTVDHHVSAILRKLGVANRTAAAVEARKLGLQDGGLGGQT